MSDPEASAAELEAMPGPIPRPDGPVLDRDFSIEELYRLRAEVAAHASAGGMIGPRLDRLLIIAGELASNAIQHGGGYGRLQLWITDQHAVVEISDQGPGGIPPGGERVPPDLSALGGRGLWLCYRMADTLDLESTRSGTVVTATVAIADLAEG